MQTRTLVCATLFLIWSAPFSLAGDKLSGDELRDLFPGHFRAVVSGLISFQITARGDGSLSAISPRGKKDRGRWSVRAGKLCIEFDNWLGARARCTAIMQDAGWYIGSAVKFKRV
jgi:hypothetical protein